MYFLLKMGIFQCHVSELRVYLLRFHIPNTESTDVQTPTLVSPFQLPSFGRPLSDSTKWARTIVISRVTLPGTNMAPENNLLEKEIPIGNHHF